MRLKNLFSIVLILVFIGASLISCDDSLKSIGGNVQPSDDDIVVGVDTVGLKAKTVSMNDSIYAATDYAVLGKYTDPIFGDIKSDYLCEFYCPSNLGFKDKTIGIDSVKLNIVYSDVSGDMDTPMGIKIYELDKELKANYFTNQDPHQFCDLKKLLGQKVFTLKDATVDIDGQTVNMIQTTIDRRLGQRFYDEYVRSGGETFSSYENLRKFFHGLYITRSLGSNTLFEAQYTDLNIYYRYTGRNKANTNDSICTSTFMLSETPEVIQLNHVQNKIPENILNFDGTRTYSKSPAGVCTEITIPFKDIVTSVKKNTDKNNSYLNSASFTLKGYTEAEKDFLDGFSRPQYLLFLNKDSVNNFFKERKMFDNKTSFLVQYSDKNNSYSFGNSMSAVINYYMDYYKDKSIDSIPDLHYRLIPVEVSSEESQQQSGESIITGVFNEMSPSAAIFRADDKNLKLGLAFSRYK